MGLMHSSGMVIMSSTLVVKIISSFNTKARNSLRHAHVMVPVVFLSSFWKRLKSILTW